MTSNPLDSADSAPLSPTAMNLAQVAGILSKLSARPVTVEMLREDIAAGAPVNADGTLNLVHFTAWLAKEVSHGD